MKILVYKKGRELARFATKYKYAKAYEEAIYAVQYHSGTKIEKLPTVVLRAKEEIDTYRKECKVKDKCYAILITSVDGSLEKITATTDSETYDKLWPNLYTCFLTEG